MILQTRSREGRHVALVLCYLATTAAGVTAFLSGWSGVISTALGWTAIAWATFLGLGGGLASAGMLTQRWFGELLGLPAMFASVGLLGAVLTVFNETRLSRVSFGLLLLGFSCALIWRWQVVHGKATEDRDVFRLRGS